VYGNNYYWLRVKEKGWTSLELSSIISHLVNLGYLKEEGLWRRILLLTDRGREVLQRHTARA
jgi:SSS family solute:Na+ symporter